MVSARKLLAGAGRPTALARGAGLGVLAALAAALPGWTQCPPDFARELEPFPVYDGLGPVPHAMYGGWQNPRPQLLDIDADGDLDLFVLEEEGQLRFFRNTGTPSAPVWSFETDDYAGVHRFYFARFVDIDADGDYDLLVEHDRFTVGQASYPSGALYTNVGTAANPDYRNRSAHPGGHLTDEDGEPIPMDQTTPDFVDLEGDGDMDLMLGDPRGTVILWRNVGTPAAPSFRYETGAYRNLDLVFGSCVPNRAPAPAPDASGAHGFMLFSFFDVNADGRPDMFIGDAFNSNVYFWLNTGGGGVSPDFSCQTESFFNAAGGGQGIFAIRILTAFGDLDGDGDPDALFGSGESSSSGLYYYRNQGPSPSSPVYVQQDSSLIPELDLGSSTVPAFADLDRDGDADLFLGAITRQRISYWQNIGTTPATPELALDTPSWLFIPNTDWLAPEAADIDGDGDLDFLVGGKAGDIRWFRNDGDGASPSDFVEVLNDPDFGDPADRLFRLTLDSQATPRAFDGDGDGDLDLIVGYYENQSSQTAPLHYFRNDGTPQQHDFVLASPDYQGLGDLGQGTAPALGDVDGDGDLDLLVGRLDGTLAFCRNEGTAASPLFRRESDAFAGIDVGARSVPALADLDGDGDVDLVVGETGGGLNFYRNRGAAVAPPTPFALVEPAADAEIAGRDRTRFVWEPSFTAGGAGGEASYELRLTPSPDAPPSEWTVFAASSTTLRIHLYSTPFRFLPELWWTVVATDGCASAPVPEWRHAVHTTPDTFHEEIPDGRDPIVHVPVDREFQLAITNAYPSPSNGATTIEYTLPFPGRARVSIHDVPGRTVAVLRDGEVSAGPHLDIWNGVSSDDALVSPGIYLVRVEQAGSVVTRRIARLR